MRGFFQVFAVLGGKGPQRVLHPVAQLRQYGIRHIGGVLGDEKHPHPLGPDQTGHLFDLVHQHLGRVLEQQMRLVEKEHQFGFVGVADLGQHLEQFRQQPQKEGRIEDGGIHQRIGGQNVDPAPPIGITGEQVHQVERWFAEQFRATLIFQHQQLPLDRAYRSGGDIAISQRQVGGVLPDPDQQRLQILKVEQRQRLFIGHPKGNVQHPLLHIGQLQQPRQQKWPHFGNRRPDRVPLFAEQIPERHRKGAVFQVKPDGRGAFGKDLVQFLGRTACRGQTRKIAFDIGQKHRHPCRRQPFGHDLQRHGLACAGGPGDQPMPVGQRQQQVLGLAVTVTTAAHKYPITHLPPQFAFVLATKYIFNLLMPECILSDAPFVLPGDLTDFLPVRLAAPSGAVFFDLTAARSTCALSPHLQLTHPVSLRSVPKISRPSPTGSMQLTY